MKRRGEAHDAYDEKTQKIRTKLNIMLIMDDDIISCRSL